MPTIEQQTFLDDARRGDLPAGAELVEARLNDVDFSGLNLSGVTFTNCNFGACVFAKADLTGARIVGGQLVGSDFSDADLSGATLQDVTVTHCGFMDARFVGAQLAGVDLSNLDFSRADFTEANLEGAVFRAAKFFDVNAQRCRATDADFTEADLREADFTEADAGGAQFSQANLGRAKFIRANLIGADLTYADLSHTNFTGAMVSGVNFENVRALETAVTDKADLGRPGEDPLTLNKTRDYRARTEWPQQVPGATGPKTPLPANYDLLAMARRAESGAAQPRDRQRDKRRFGRRLAMVVLLGLSIAAAIIVYKMTSQAEPRTFVGDEFVGWIKGPKGRKAVARLELDLQRQEKRYIYQTTITLVGAADVPRFLKTRWAPDRPLRAFGTSQFDSMAQLRIINPGSDDEINGLLMNCETRFSYDLDWEMFAGFFLQTGQRVGTFEFKRPRRGNRASK